MHRATIKRALAALERAGIISRTKRFRNDGGSRATLYQLGPRWDLYVAAQSHRKPTTSTPATPRRQSGPSALDTLDERLEAERRAAIAAGYSGMLDARSVRAFLQEHGAGNHAGA